jgi:hypothetical protein
VIAGIEWHPGELLPKIGVHRHQYADGPRLGGALLNQLWHRREAASRACAKEGSCAFHWAHLFYVNEIRLQLYALTYNLAPFLRCIAQSPCSLPSWRSQAP